MKFPILRNAAAVVRGWDDEGDDKEEIEPHVTVTGQGEKLDEDKVSQLVSELTALTDELDENDNGRRKFDQRAAVLLAKYLPLSVAEATERRFWQWFAITQAPAVVRWRWGHVKQISRHRWMGGWKDTFRRLWVRAQIVCDSDSADPFELATRGDEDFWVGIIEREIAQCPAIVAALVGTFFPANDGDSNRSKQRMDHYRGTIKRLRQIRPSRVFEAMTQAEAQSLVNRIVKEAAPSGTDADGRPRSRRKNHNPSSGPTARTRKPHRHKIVSAGQ